MTLPLFLAMAVGIAVATIGGMFLVFYGIFSFIRDVFQEMR